MKAKIKDKSQLTLQLKQYFTFDILSDEGEVLLADQTIEATPSNAIEDIRKKLSEYQTEYELSASIELELEII